MRELLLGIAFLSVWDYLKVVSAVVSVDNSLLATCVSHALALYELAAEATVKAVVLYEHRATVDTVWQHLMEKIVHASCLSTVYYGRHWQQQVIHLHRTACRQRQLHLAVEHCRLLSIGKAHEQHRSTPS